MTMLPAPRPMDGLAPYHAVPDFYADARALRADVERFFADSDKASAQHQVWNYRYLPDSCTCLRTLPEKVIERAKVERFVQRLSAFAWQNLGLSRVTWPYLSLYVEGCGQQIRSDTRNGAFSYVHSLTPWEQRRFSGGETQIFRELGDGASGRFRASGAGASLYELVETRFNQLLVFDPRLIHGVPPLRGVADPLEGRLVLHGHLELAGVTAGGPLDAVFQRDGIGALGELLAQAQAGIEREPGRYHGFATYAINIVPSGEVHSVVRLVQRVLAHDGPQRGVPALTGLAAQLAQLRFPRAEGPSRVVVPLRFD